MAVPVFRLPRADPRPRPTDFQKTVGAPRWRGQPGSALWPALAQITWTNLRFFHSRTISSTGAWPRPAARSKWIVRTSSRSWRSRRRTSSAGLTAFGPAAELAIARSPQHRCGVILGLRSSTRSSSNARCRDRGARAMELNSNHAVGCIRPSGEHSTMSSRSMPSSARTGLTCPALLAYLVGFACGHLCRRRRPRPRSGQWRSIGVCVACARERRD